MRAIDPLKYSVSFYKIDQAKTLTRIHELAKLLDLDRLKKIDDLSYFNE